MTRLDSMQHWHDFLQQQGFSILQQGGIHHSNASQGAEAYVTDLSNYGTLTLTGPDASKFLQGQLTCNLDQLKPEQGLAGAYCSPKGSVISNFDLLQVNDQVMLHMAADVVESVNTALAKYIVFSKAKLHNQNNDWVRLGMWGQKAHEALEQVCPVPSQDRQVAEFEHGFVFCSNAAQQRYVIYCQPDAAIDLWLQLADHARPTSTAQWEISQIKDGLIYVSEEVSQHYVPQMLNLQEMGSINFQKGCYTGQEVVARMQYLGKLKRHLYLGRITSTTPIQVGMQIDASKRGNIGRITSLAQADDSLYWFTAVINIKEAEDPEDTLSIGGVDVSQVEIDPLPYAIDEQVFERIRL